MHLMLFTDFVPEKSMHETMGYSMIGFILLYLGGNIFLVAMSAFHSMKLSAIRYYNRLGHKKSEAQVVPVEPQPKVEVKREVTKTPRS